MRTLGRDFSQHSISNRAPSATRTHLLITNHRNKQILQCKEQSEVTERFELSVGSPTTVFKTVALNRSAKSPLILNIFNRTELCLQLDFNPQA